MPEIRQVEIREQRKSTWVGAGWKTLGHDINGKLWLPESDALSAEASRRTRQASRCAKKILSIISGIPLFAHHAIAMFSRAKAFLTSSERSLRS
jgi:hypothetical protein